METVTFGFLSALCAASEDVGWFRIKRIAIKKKPLCEALCFRTEMSFIMHSTELDSNLYTDSNRWCVKKL